MRAIPCSFADVLTLTRHDPAVRGIGRCRNTRAWRTADAAADPTSPWGIRGAVGYVGVDAEDEVPVFVAFGLPEAAAAVVTAAAGEMPAGIRVTVPHGSCELLDGRLRLAGVSRWHFRATYTPPPRQPAEDRAGWLADSAHSEVRTLLEVANPGSSAWPGDPKVRRWAGIRDDAGRLVACLADTSGDDTGGEHRGIGHVSAIAVHPAARGRRLGPSITAWATRVLFTEGRDVVTLGVYADNTVGLRMYDRLGFTIDHPFASGVLVHAAPRPVGTDA